MQSDRSQPITRHIKHTIKIDHTYSLHVQAVGDLVNISVTAMGITVFQRSVTPDNAMATANALSMAAGF